MNFWEKYRKGIELRCTENRYAKNDVSYWRDKLFAITMSYILPLTLIAIIPGIFMGLLVGSIAIVIFDIAVLVLLILIIAPTDLPVIWRKRIFCFIAYSSGVFLLFFIDDSGPGLLYLLAVSIFFILIFHSRNAFISFYVNLFVCLLVGVFIKFNLIPYETTVQVEGFEIEHWIAVSANLLFLSAVFSFLIPKLFFGLEASLDKQIELGNKLKVNQESLSASVKKLEQKNEELEQFAYVASHDLQEPLRMVSGFVSKLEQRYNDKLDDKGRQYISLAVGGCKRMKNIIIDLLDFSRTGITDKEIELFDVQMVVNDIIGSHQNLIEEKKALIKTNQLPQIYSYRLLITQVLQNLISNALKYSKKDEVPIVEISCEKTPEYWKFKVQDNGIGIEEEYFSKIFVLFQRLHDKDEYSGTGIGLAIVKKAIESMGGEVCLESEENKGTTFYFTIPVIEKG
ncbi:MAG: hypothetical protein EA412_09700 [Chitinophagaceae bacterium]|nr:MAG: hypothetical protein EA412_09700 [Chitinophagaceae bacterium]